MHIQNNRVLRVHSNPNVYQVSVPLEGVSLGSTNCYIFESEGEALIIDAGFNDHVSLSTLTQALADLKINPRQTSLFITHFHSDHVGAAANLLPSECKRYMSATDHAYLASFSDETRNAHRRLLTQEGAPNYILEKCLYLFDQCIGNLQDAHITDLYDNDVLTVGKYALQVLQTPGHTPGHLCLYQEESQLLFLGDHVLFDISANICHLPGHPHMLIQFIESLQRIAHYPVKQCFVAHHSNGNGEDLKQRIEALISHHQERLDDILQALMSSQEELSAFQITQRIPWKARKLAFDKLNMLEAYFAQSETLSHLELLVEKNVVSKQMKHGIYHYYLNNKEMAIYEILENVNLKSIQAF